MQILKVFVSEAFELVSLWDRARLFVFVFKHKVTFLVKKIKTFFIGSRLKVTQLSKAVRKRA